MIIHSAAERRPDVVDKREDATHQLNVKATEVICKEAGVLVSLGVFGDDM